MALDIRPFTPADLDAAAALLAARHAADRARTPVLPAAFADPARARGVLESILAEPYTGVAAWRAGRLVGYLLGIYRLPAPTSARALLLWPRSVVVRYPAHAADPADAATIYPALYAALSAQWVAAGYFAHYIYLPAAGRPALDTWADLGFGRDSAFAGRSTSPPPAESARPADLDIRVAGATDLPLLNRLVADLFRHHAAPPLYAPYLPEVEPDMNAHNAEVLANPANRGWLAFAGGRPAGFYWLEARPGAGLDLSQPDSTIHLNMGYTDPALRGQGIGTILLARSLAWARAAGYTYCTLHYMTANLLGARFWTRHGFAPLTYRLGRPVDPRIAWAGSGL